MLTLSDGDQDLDKQDAVGTEGHLFSFFDVPVLKVSYYGQLCNGKGGSGPWWAYWKLYVWPERTVSARRSTCKRLKVQTSGDNECAFLLQWRS